MTSFEKLFVNSTNRLAAVKNIILSDHGLNRPLVDNKSLNEKSISNKNAMVMSFNHILQGNESFEELKLRYDELSKTVKEANHEKQAMESLIEKIFKIEQGKEEKLKKRFRRKKSDLQAKYQCNIPACSKIYTSAASLARHSKLKHVYSKFEPPSHNYQIPPSPNLCTSTKGENRPEGQPNSISLEEEKDEDIDGDARNLPEYDPHYDADCSNSDEN